MSSANLNRSRLSELLPGAIIPLILLVFAVDWFYDLELLTKIVLSCLLIAGMALLVLRFKQVLLYTLSLAIPLSIQMPVIGNSKIGFPSEMIAVLLSGFFIIKLVTGYRLPKNFMGHPITLLIILDIAWLFISSCFSGMPDVSFKRLIVRVIYYITFYYFYYELYRSNRKSISTVIILHLCGLLIPVLYTLYIHYHMGFMMMGSQLISAPFYFDHTIYGTCVVFFIPFLVYRVLSARSLRQRLLFSLLLLSFLIATYFSYSRAAWLSLLIAMSIFFIYWLRISRKHLIRIGIVVILLLTVNTQKLSTVFKENKQVSHTNDVAMHLKSVSNISTDASNKERVNRWKCALRMFADKPLLGFGPGTYQFFYGPYQQRNELTRISTFTGNKGHAHSEYLNYLSETGLPGFLIFCSLITVILIRGFRLISREADEEKKYTAVFLVCCLCTYFVHAFFNGFLEFDKVAMPVLSSVAAITFLDLENKSHRSDTSASC